MPASNIHSHGPAYESGFLKVSSIHKIHYEQYGKEDGKPVLFLHGGPGGSTSIKSTIFFDPAVYRVVLIDQRGCGKSQPCAELRENTTTHLLSDLELLREHISVSKWHMVFGGSWGSTLAMLYAEAQPSRVGSLVLRGIFTATKDEFDFSRGSSGAARLWPELYDEWISYLPTEEDRADPLKGYYRLLTDDNPPEVRLAASRAYNRWELSVSATSVGDEAFKKLDDEDWTLSHARLECHYHTHLAWLEDKQILRDVGKIRHIPCTIVQGRLDLVCTPRVAWDLHKAWPESELLMIPMAGHSAYEPGIQDKLIEACDKYGKEDFHL